MYSHYSDEMWMRYALMLAGYAEHCGDVAVGSIVVLNERVIGKGWNSSVVRHDPTAHAEVMALRQAGRMIGNYRLLRTTLYVTLEPCIMCFGAMIHARIFRLVYGAQDKKNGIMLRKNYLKYLNFNHHIVCKGGVLQDLCSHQITNFFYKKRSKKCIGKM